MGLNKFDYDEQGGHENYSRKDSGENISQVEMDLSNITGNDVKFLPTLPNIWYESHKSSSQCR